MKDKNKNIFTNKRKYILFFIPLVLIFFLKLFVVENINHSLTRIEGFPFPFYQTPDTLFIIDEANFTRTQLIAIQSLQGILAQTKPRIYRVNKFGYKLWLNDLIENYGVIADSSYIADFYGLINKFKNEISGYIIYEDKSPSVYIAVSVAGIEKAIPITSLFENQFAKLGLTSVADVRHKNYQWLDEHYLNKFNRNLIFYSSQKSVPYLSDYAVFSKSIFYYKDISNNLLTKIFSRINKNSVLFGWGENEFNLIKNSSENSVIVLPSDWALNLSVLSNFDVETKQNSHSIHTATIDNVHTVCFVMTDGDNIQWLLNKFATSNKWFGNNSINNIQLGWTISPSLAELAPTVLKEIYNTANKNSNGRNYFIAGPSGYGYIFPDKYKDLKSYTLQLNKLLYKSDLNIVNIIGNSMDEKYLLPFVKQINVSSLFFYFYSNYSGGNGKILWLNNKPIITGRYNFWDGFENAKTLADKLNNSSIDIHSSKGYSLIPVHVWTKTVDSVVTCINKLNKNVRVVTPDEFVSLIKTNVPH